MRTKEQIEEEMEKIRDRMNKTDGLYNNIFHSYHEGQINALKWVVREEVRKDE